MFLELGTTIGKNRFKVEKYTRVKSDIQYYRVYDSKTNKRAVAKVEQTSVIYS